MLLNLLLAILLRDFDEESIVEMENEEEELHNDTVSVKTKGTTTTAGA